MTTRNTTMLALLLTTVACGYPAAKPPTRPPVESPPNPGWTASCGVGDAGPHLTCAPTPARETPGQHLRWLCRSVDWVDAGWECVSDGRVDAGYLDADAAPEDLFDYGPEFGRRPVVVRYDLAVVDERVVAGVTWNW